MSGIVRGVGVLVAGMAAGASLAWGSGLSAAHSVALPSLLDVHRDVHAARANLSVLLDGLAVLVTVVAAFRLRGKPPALPPAGLAVIALLLAGGLGVFVCEPLSRTIAGWSGATAPIDAIDRISLLSRLLMARAVLEGMAGLFLVASLLRDRHLRRVRHIHGVIPMESPEPPNRTVFVPGSRRISRQPTV